MSGQRPSSESARSKFQATLIRVMIVQVLALSLLGLIQILYNA